MIGFRDDVENYRVIEMADFKYRTLISKSSRKSYGLRKKFGCVRSFIYFRLFGISANWEFPFETAAPGDTRLSLSLKLF